MSAKLRPSLSDGGQELLRIALENDRHEALPRNGCLQLALHYLLRLSAACRDSSGRSLGILLRTDTLPTTFLTVAFSVLREIRAELDELLRTGRGLESMPLVTDFDRHVFQALAETLADIGWPERAAVDFDGPALGVVQRRLASVERQTLIIAFLTNYVGNILQDGFAAARIREAVRNLPDDAEYRLRSDDAAAIARAVVDNVGSNEGDLSPVAVLSEFASTIWAFRA